MVFFFLLFSLLTELLTFDYSPNLCTDKQINEPRIQTKRQVKIACSSNGRKRYGFPTEVESDHCTNYVNPPECLTTVVKATDGEEVEIKNGQPPERFHHASNMQGTHKGFKVLFFKIFVNSEKFNC